LPIYFSSILKNPLLILHGIVDNNVMLQETLTHAFRRATEFLDRNLSGQ
jgi:dipeptidyl aminopeptidase/acylaminoacyl peptidase